MAVPGKLLHIHAGRRAVAGNYNLLLLEGINIPFQIVQILLLGFVGNELLVIKLLRLQSQLFKLLVRISFPYHTLNQLSEIFYHFTGGRGVVVVQVPHQDFLHHRGLNRFFLAPVLSFIGQIVVIAAHQADQNDSYN